jgi:hypothetical protein
MDRCQALVEVLARHRQERRHPLRRVRKQVVYSLLLHRTWPTLRIRLRQQEAPPGSTPSGVSSCSALFRGELERRTFK